MGPGEDFYAVPEGLAEGEPGEVIRVQEVPAPAGTKGWRVLYHSRSVAGDDIAVSGLVFAPEVPAASPRPVVAWAHGSVGLGDGCAPSRFPELLPAAPIFSQLLREGFVLAATDYEGLGTPGPHPWLVGQSEGRSVLDSVRAAARIPNSGAGKEFVAFGASQGGGGALFAGELTPTYAEELELKGVVAEAPAAELDLVAFALQSDLAGEGLSGLAMMGILGFKAAYPELSLEQVLKPEFVAQKDEVEQLCQSQIDRRFRGLPLGQVLAANPANVDPWGSKIVENTPGNQKLPGPVLLIHGSADPLVPPEVSELLFRRLCGMEVQTERRVYEGAGHVDVFIASSDDVHKWITDRFAGRPLSPGEAAQSCL